MTKEEKGTLGEKAPQWAFTMNCNSGVARNAY